jgi:hypothetical protein
MLASLTVLFALHLATALLGKKRPGDTERRVTIGGFCLLVSALIGQKLPLAVVAVLSLYVAAYLHKAR